MSAAGALCRGEHERAGATAARRGATRRSPSSALDERARRRAYARAARHETSLAEARAMILDDIVAEKRREHAARERARRSTAVARVGAAAGAAFAARCGAPGAVRASPSSSGARRRPGASAPAPTPPTIARALRAAGAAALSVLTDAPFFDGSLGRPARRARAGGAAAAAQGLPARRRDRPGGAAGRRRRGAAHRARCSPRDAARAARRRARRLGVAALVEAHDERELEARSPPARRIIGVNHRDLDTLHDRSDAVGRALRALAPADATLVAESGIGRRPTWRDARGAAPTPSSSASRSCARPTRARALRGAARP